MLLFTFIKYLVLLANYCCLTVKHFNLILKHFKEQDIANQYHGCLIQDLLVLHNILFTKRIITFLI